MKCWKVQLNRNIFISGTDISFPENLKENFNFQGYKYCFYRYLAFLSSPETSKAISIIKNGLNKLKIDHGANKQKK